MNLVRATIGRLGRNASLNILPQPLFSIPFYLYSSYSTLYMMKLGVSGVEVGILNSVSFATRSVAALFVAYIVNRLGRKKSVLLFDMIAWVIPYIILSFANSLWQFLIASMISGFGIVNGVAWNCYIVEDVKPGDRINAFSILEIMTIVCGFITPVAGILIARYSLVSTIRSIYLFAAGCMVVWVLLRLILMTETSVGKKIKEEGNISRWGIFINFWNTLKIIIKKRRLIALFSVSIMTNFCLTIYNLFYIPYLTVHLNYSESCVSVIPMIISVVALMILLLVVPKTKRSDKLMVFGIVLYTTGSILLLVAPARNSLIFIALNILCWAVSKSVVNVVLQTQIANTIEDSKRADVMGLFNILSTLAMLPAGIVGGVLYGMSPKSPFILVFFLYFISFIIYIYAGRMFTHERRINHV